MSPKEIAMSAYYHATYPARRILQRRMERNGRAPIGVLFYHRVADVHPNDWTISNIQFRRQMLWLKRHFDVISLGEAQRRIRSGRNDRTAVVITFDDGYAENCDQAIPFLIEQQIPATYFVALDFVENDRPFPHDVKAGVALKVNTPEQIREMSRGGIEIGSHTRTHCDVGAINDLETMIDEIQTATDRLAEMADQRIRFFAFPYGQINNLSAAAARLAERCGIEGVCSAFGAYNFPGQDAFHLRRIHGDPEFIRLKNWLTVDPRKTSIAVGFHLPESALHSRAVDTSIDTAVTPPVPTLSCGSSALGTLPISDNSQCQG